jgi:hypothetical protein
MKRVFGLLLMLISLNSVFAAGVVIVSNGSANAKILVAANSSAQVKKAAKTLQSYIQKSSGALLPIVSSQSATGIFIHVGLTNYAKNNGFAKVSVDEDGYVIKTVDNSNIVIVGGSDNGTEFGVYTFLEKFLHVHWLMPTDIGTDIPKSSTISIPITSISESPVYLSRQLSPIDPESNNSLGVWGRVNKLRERVNFHHNMSNLFDPKSLKNTNPDFYPMVKGKRYIPASNKDSKWQPNFSANGIADTASNRIIQYFKNNPNEKSYSLGINDSKVFDESSLSLSRRIGKKNFLKLEDVSDDYFKWANSVATKVNATYPTKKFGILAFNNIAEPPSAATGVNSHIIPFITYERMRWSNPALMQRDQELTRRWDNAVPDVGWYDYAYGLNYLMPRVWFHTMQQYLSWGAQNHVKYYYAELYPNWGEGPKAWLLAKLLWNPDQNVDALLDEWYTSFGGTKSAASLKSFYGIWEKFWTKDIYSSGWNRLQGQYLPYDDFSYLKAIPQSYITDSDNLLNQAYQQAGTAEQKQRVGDLKDMWALYKASYNSYNKNSGSNTLSLSSFSMKSKGMNPSPEMTAIMNRLKSDSLHSFSIGRMNKIFAKKNK